MTNLIEFDFNKQLEDTEDNYNKFELNSLLLSYSNNKKITLSKTEILYIILDFCNYQLIPFLETDISNQFDMDELVTKTLRFLGGLVVIFKLDDTKFVETVKETPTIKAAIEFIASSSKDKLMHIIMHIFNYHLINMYIDDLFEDEDEKYFDSDDSNVTKYLN